MRSAPWRVGACGTCAALEIREFARSGILYYLVRPVLFPELTTQLTVAPRSRSLPDLKTRGGPRTTQMRVLRSGSYSQMTAVRPVGARAVAVVCRPRFAVRIWRQTRRVAPPFHKHVCPVAPPVAHACDVPAARANGGGPPRAPI